MDKNRKVRGFTMAEMLIVVAIIMVLSGVAFIAVASHQRSMAQLERDTVAKEIFVAAQNHLTMAESQGYLPDEKGSVDYGNTEDPVPTVTGRTNSNVYSFSVSGASNFTGGSILDLMLPFGSIDDTIRSGGSYIIRYQAKPAIVLDVFYCPKSSSSSGQLRFTHDLGNNKYSEVATYAGAGTDRKHCLGDNCVLGWYGNDAAGDSGEYIETPRIEVINKERLLVNVFDPNNSATDPNSLASLCLIITGEKRGDDETSRPQAAIQLKNDANNRFKWVPESNGVEGHYEVILDDITTATGTDDDGLHFSDLNRTKNTAITLKKDASGNAITFKPGENITVQVVAYSNSELTNIAYSVERTTNSLFADSGVTPTTAMIGNFRHLENLDIAVSGLDSTLGFNKAEQIGDLAKPASAEDSEGSGTDGEDEEDLSWTGFVNAIKAAKGSDTVKIYKTSDTTGTEVNCYRPVDLTYQLEYDGQNHTIEGVGVKYGADAGLFGSISAPGSKVSNLELIDFNISTTSGDAGALAGTMTGTTVTNVVAYHTDGKADTAKITTTSGSAGGLIGSIAGGTSVSKSAAALIVSATGGNAGGLIGKSTSTGTVSGCYAGGHTIESGEAVIYSDTAFNVTATRAEGATTGGVAGGLIGDAGSTEISYSYSTCSAKGVTVGGLIGTGSGAITSSYCTGKVNGTTQGAFAGECGTTTDCHYFEIINEFTDATVGYDYLTPVPKEKTTDGKGKPSGLDPIDETAQSYNDFCGAAKDSQEKDLWNPASPYTAKLTQYYNGRYNLRTVEQLGASVTKNSGAEGDTTIDDFVVTHYGDWPAPEIFVVNTKGTTATPATPTP